MAIYVLVGLVAALVIYLFYAVIHPSGLDPDISPAHALLQAPRVARTRGVPVETIIALIDRHIAGRSLGVFGEPHVNVLALNLALQHVPAALEAPRRER